MKRKPGPAIWKIALYAALMILAVYGSHLVYDRIQAWWSVLIVMACVLPLCLFTAHYMYETENLKEELSETKSQAHGEKKRGKHDMNVAWVNLIIGIIALAMGITLLTAGGTILGWLNIATGMLNVGIFGFVSLADRSWRATA